MDTSIFLAKFWGWYLLIYFFLFLIYPKRIKQLFELTKDTRFVIIISFLAIILGLLNIIAHNIWVLNWRIIITLFGWITLLKGITLFAFPKFTIKMIDRFDSKWFHFLIFPIFVIGILLLNQVYHWVQF